MMPFAPRNDVAADFVDLNDGLAAIVVTGDHASDLQGHGRSAIKDRDGPDSNRGRAQRRTGDELHMTSAPALRVDVASLIDDRPISALQVRVFVLCALI